MIYQTSPAMLPMQLSMVHNILQGLHGAASCNPAAANRLLQILFQQHRQASSCPVSTAVSN